MTLGGAAGLLVAGVTMLMTGTRPRQAIVSSGNASADSVDAGLDWTLVETPTYRLYGFFGSEEALDVYRAEMYVCGLQLAAAVGREWWMPRRMAPSWAWSAPRPAA